MRRDSLWIHRSFTLAIAALLVSASAYAVDGVTEINQTCAEQTGCLVGDDSGFPVTINTAGSYRLTGNLLATEGGAAIVVNGTGVTLDLGGFEVRCQAGCNGPGIDSRVGIVEVRNGTVRGVDDGIRVASGTVLHGLRAFGGNNAIVAGDACRIYSSQASSPGVGVLCGAGCRIFENTLVNNITAGVVAGRGSLVERNLVRIPDDLGSSGLILTDAGYRDNNISASGNFTDLVNGGTNLGGNFCTTSLGVTACP